MRQLRELLRVHLLGGRRYAECGRALAIGAPLYRSVDSILKRGVEQQPRAVAEAPLPTVAQHDNVRGPDCYH